MNEYFHGEFRGGEVIGQGLRVFRQNFLAFAVLTAIFYGLTFAVGFVLGSTLGPGDFDEQGQVRTSSANLVLAVIGLSGAAMTYLLTASLTYATFCEMRGRRASVGACVGNGLSVLFPVLGVGILSLLVMGVGFLLLVIPGIIFATMLWVAIPVAVVERPGVMKSLERSRELSKGYRMSIFGIMFILVLLQWIAALGIQLIGSPESTFVGIITEVLSAAFMVLFAVTPAVGYFHLRNVKEGVDIDELAAVFD